MAKATRNLDPRAGARALALAGALALLGGLARDAWAGPPPRRPAPDAASTQPAGASASQPAGSTSAAAPAAPATQPAPADDTFLSRALTPLGFSRLRILPNSLHRPVDPGRAAAALPDRWRIGWPEWNRYNRTDDLDPLLMNHDGGDSPYTAGDPLNPYDRNLFKGDYPVNASGNGRDIFVSGTFISDTLFTFRRLPTPSGASAANSSSFDFFGDGEQIAISQTVLASFEIFQGYTAFRPVDWLVRITPVFNANYLRLEEQNGVNVDPRDGDTRGDSYANLQEGFFEYHLGDTSHNFDIAAARVGRQIFISDFRGFIFNDVADGFRLMGNLESNRVQYNLGLFAINDKDTNSGLNEMNWRDQQVFIANTYIQDFLFPGYTTQFSFHYNLDQSDREYDNNGFQTIPELVGSTNLHDVQAAYFGWAGDGHIGRLNINHAAYYVTGHDNGNPIAGTAVDISAWMAAIELSVDMDWFRPKASVLYASGDRDPTDGKATGFDGILDNPTFAGGAGSFFQSQAFRLLGTNLKSSRSLYNDLASSKGEGQSNFVNPGTLLFNAGFDMELTPKLRSSFNFNSVYLAQTESVELLLNQQNIDGHFGDEVNASLQYRPLLNNNIILTLGGSVFFPGEGFRNVYESRAALFQLFTGVTLTY